MNWSVCSLYVHVLLAVQSMQSTFKDNMELQNIS